MKNWFKKNFKSYMIRPIIYRALPRFLIALIVALAWDRFVNTSELFKMNRHVFPILGFVFIGLAWFSFLHLDGVGVGFSKKKEESKKEKKINYSDIADYVDEQVTYDDLSGNEKSACTLAANLICSALLFILSLF